MKQFEPIFFTPPRNKLNRQLYKGGSAPKPDPQIGKAALETAAIGRDAFQFYKQEYIDNKPNQDRLNELSQQVQEQLIESGEFNNLASKDYYNYMQETFRPLEKSIVKDAQDYDTAGRREAEASKGLSDVRQGFDTQRQIALRNKERSGVNPNSGNAMALGNQLDTQEAIASADAVNSGRTRAEMTGKAMKMDAASLGRNLPSNQATSQQIANSSASAGLNAGLAGAANDRAGLSVYGTGVDAATRGLSTQADILQRQYNGQLQAYQAKQASNDSAWGNIGSLVGTGAAIFGGFKDGGLVDLKEIGLDSITPKNINIIDNETGQVFEGEGAVQGDGSETSDSIPARLSNNEFVMNAGVKKMNKKQIIAAAKKSPTSAGLDTLEAINNQGLEFRGSK